MTSKSRSLSSLLSRAAVGLVGCALASAVLAAKPTIRTVNGATGAIMPNVQSQAGGDGIDYANARPLPLPIATNYSAESVQAELVGMLASPSAASTTRPVYVRGAAGDGKESPTSVPKSRFVSQDDEFAPQEAGTSNHPFSTARADGFQGTTNKTYPFRASGKVFFKKPGDSGTYICSASLIKKGVVVTAAHCVTEYGKKTFYTNFQFIPGYKSGAAPYGKWTAKETWVKNEYFNGKDQCSQKGVVCKNDVAVVVLNPQSGKLPGTSTGWYGYGYNNAGFSGNRTHVTQIGYPGCLDNGEIMERNDSEGVKSSSNANNTLIGSLMCGGSSGGPWIANFGKRPNLTGTTSGSQAQINMVIGVTSWGSTSNGPKEQGASPFLNTNIQSLIDTACNGNSAQCSN